MSAAIRPTVGRVVLFHQGTAGVFPGSDEPRAAVVAHVHTPDLVNLCVFDANGSPHSRTSVPLVQEGETPPANGYYCEWMAYQKGQAAKTEAAEKEPTEARARTPARQT